MGHLNTSDSVQRRETGEGSYWVYTVQEACIWRRVESRGVGTSFSFPSRDIARWKELAVNCMWISFIKYVRGCLHPPKVNSGNWSAKDIVHHWGIHPVERKEKAKKNKTMVTQYTAKADNKTESGLING